MMPTLRDLLAVGLLAAVAFAQEQESCVTRCHGAEAKAFVECVHRGRLRCTNCHGGNPKAHGDMAKSHDVAAGYRGTPTRGKIPALCAECHSDPMGMHAFALPTDQLAHYRTSKHGLALAKGNTAVAVCTDCHGVHRILPAHDPRAPTARRNQPETCGKCHSNKTLMQSHDLPWDSVDRFRSSVHGISLLVENLRGAPSCADCHGSHGASPPGVDGIVQVCGHCHQNTAEYFRKSPHANAEEMRCGACHEEKGSEYERAGCAACHNAHAIGPAGPGLYQGDEVGRCGHCHRGDDKAAENVSRSIAEGRKQVRDAMARTRHEIDAAKDRGLFLVNEHVYLGESERMLVSLRPLTHSMDPEAIGKHLRDGLERQDRTREVIAKKTKVLRDRRLLLSGLAAILLLLTALLAAKLQAIRRLS